MFISTELDWVFSFLFLVNIVINLVFNTVIDLHIYYHRRVFFFFGKFRQYY